MIDAYIGQHCLCTYVHILVCVLVYHPKLSLDLLRLLLTRLELRAVFTTNLSKEDQPIDMDCIDTSTNSTTIHPGPDCLCTYASSAKVAAIYPPTEDFVTVPHGVFAKH